MKKVTLFQNKSPKTVIENGLTDPSNAKDEPNGGRLFTICNLKVNNKENKNISHYYKNELIPRLQCMYIKQTLPKSIYQQLLKINYNPNKIKYNHIKIYDIVCSKSYIKYSYITSPYYCYYSIYIHNTSKYLSLAPFQPLAIYCIILEKYRYSLQNAVFSSFLPINFKLASRLPALWWEDKWRTSITIKNNTANKQNYSPIPYQLLK